MLEFVATNGIKIIDAVTTSTTSKSLQRLWFHPANRRWHHHHHPKQLQRPITFLNNNQKQQQQQQQQHEQKQQDVVRIASICRGGGSSSSSTSTNDDDPTIENYNERVTNESNKDTESTTEQPPRYGRIADDEYKLTPEQIEQFFTDGCVTLEAVLREDEIRPIEIIFDRFITRDIVVPGKDFCDMSKPFGVPYETWSIVNCMLPTTYYPPFQNNIYERLTANIVQQLFPQQSMTKDYDQLLNKRPGKSDAVFAWHQDMAYWPGPKTLGVSNTETVTCSLAIDDSTFENGCLRYIPRSGRSKTFYPHRPLYKTDPTTGDREEGHALTVDIDEVIASMNPNETTIASTPATATIAYAPVRRGSITIHDEYIVHGSDGNKSPDQQRRTYVLAYRAANIVEAERRIGFTHSHNDVMNWDTFLQEQEQHENETSDPQ